MVAPLNLIAVDGITVASADYLNSLVQWTPNLASLRNFVGTSNMAVILLGLSAPNDGGQGVFSWSPTSPAQDDGANIIRPNGVTVGAWIREGIVPGLGKPVVFLAAGTTTAAVCMTNYVAQGACTLVLQQTVAATPACVIEVFAQGGPLTLALSASTDNINGGAPGAALVIQTGYAAEIWNDGNGHYYAILSIGTGASNVVTSFNGRGGVVTLTSADVTGAGGATLASPAFTGTPTAPTAAPGTNNTQLATTAFVTNFFASAGVASFNTRTGAVTLTAADVTGVGGLLSATAASTYAPIASPTLTGVPAAPTAAPGTSTTQLATTAFVAAAVVASTTGVAGWGPPGGPYRTGNVALQSSDITAAGGALLASPAFTGNPTAPTPAVGDNSTSLATTAYVTAGFLPLAGGTVTGNLTVRGITTLGAIGQWTVDQNGNMNTSGIASAQNFQAKNGIYPYQPDTTYGLYVDGASNRFFTYANGYYWYWSASSGQLNWYTPGAGPSLSITNGGTVTIAGQMTVTDRTGIHYGTGSAAHGMAFQWSGGVITAWVDNIHVGNLAFTSDARLKEVIGYYRAGLKELIRLNPIRYRWNGAAGLFPNDGHEHVGLLAQEVEGDFPDAVSKGEGEINGVKVNDLRSLDPGKLVYAMLNALQEIDERLRRLEHRVSD